MKKFFLAASAVLFAMTGQAQMVQDSIWDINNFEWAKTPEMEKDTAVTKLDEAVLNYNHFLQFAYEGDESVLYELIHRRIWVGNEKVIQSYNKLYLPIYEENAALQIKARVLLPNGEVTEVDETNIQKGKDEEDNEYNYFALDGVQEGSIVEYIFLTKIRPSYMGTRITLQRTAPILNLNFSLVAPYNLLFKVKSYNSLAEPQEDTVLSEQNHWYIEQKDLAKFEEEPSAYGRSNMGYIVYALDRNLFSGKRDISSFGYLSANIFENVHVEIDKKTAKSFKKIIAESKMNDAETDELKIARLENYLKQNFFITTNGGAELFELSSIIERHAMSELGALRLYHGIFAQAGFPNQLVFTSDKSNTKFDAEFESNLLIGENFLYFTNQDVFLQPSGVLSRLGYFSEDMRNTQALFIEGVDIGAGMEGIGEVREIPALDYKLNKAELVVNWHLDADGDLGEVKMERKMWGQQTNYMQTLNKFVSEEDMEEFKKGILDWMYGEVDMQDYEVENFEAENFPGKPLIVRANFSDEVYTEPGSTSTVVKVGEIIGPQSEMYLTDSVRLFDIHHGFPKWYNRKIIVHIPEGHQLKNVESLAMLVSSGEEDPRMLFRSEYTLKDNVLEIVIDEWYQGGDYPAVDFEIYRDVINAAADFNKKYVVLEAMK